MDLISRQSVLALPRNRIRNMRGENVEELINVVDIEALPPAQSERKTGKWIRITQGAMPEQYICPFCHRTVESYGAEDLLSIRYPYCHCGADMRGEQDEYFGEMPVLR